jgi:glycosyltransferase involved in cell wall biosynthesis
MKLSVLMLTYNHGHFIAQALASILSQQVNFEYEVVVGEDFSTDGTRRVLMDFHRRYPGRIVPLLQNKNLGAMANFAATLAACKGDYIAFLEGDDYWTNDFKLQKQVDFLDRHPGVALCCHRVALLDENGISGLGSDMYPKIPSGPYVLEDLLKVNFVMTCSALLRRNLIGSLPSWFYKLALSDWPLFALVARYGSIQLMDETMAAYRVHPTSSWSSRPVIFRHREISRMLRHLDRHLEFRYTNILGPAVFRCDLDAALLERENGRRAATGMQVLTCIRNGGWQVREERRKLAALAAYALFGRWYKAFSKANWVGHN